MINKVILAIDSTGLSELVPRSLPMKTRPDEMEVLVLQVVEPLLYTAPPEMSPGYQPENTARRKELKDRAKESLALAVEALCKEGYRVNSRLIEAKSQKESSGPLPSTRRISYQRECQPFGIHAGSRTEY